jgi:hypothetical protein
MSDRGDYREPNAGDWMLVFTHGTGETVACMKVESVCDGIARLTDNSSWGAETGEPIHRRWAGHYLWPVDKVNDLDSAVDMLYDASLNALGEVYSILFRDKQARGNPPLETKDT